MKKLYIIVSLSLMLTGGTSFSQFTYVAVDTIEYRAPSTMAGAEIVTYSNLYNNTANSISMRVTREKNVMTDAPNWESAFCMDVCYLKTTDSVNYTFNPYDTVHFSFHFYIELEPGPDSACAIMRWRDVNNSSNSFTQRFHGITQTGFSVNELNAHLANVSIHPMPVVSGSTFSMAVSNVQTKGALSLVVYDLFGRVVNTTPSLIEGINLMSLDLPAGVYSYALVSGSTVLNSGKLVMAE